MRGNLSRSKFSPRTIIKVYSNCDKDRFGKLIKTLIRGNHVLVCRRRIHSVYRFTRNTANFPCRSLRTLHKDNVDVDERQKYSGFVEEKQEVCMLCTCLSLLLSQRKRHEMIT